MLKVRMSLGCHGRVALPVIAWQQPTSCPLSILLPPPYSRPADWQQLHGAEIGGRAMRALLAAGEASAMHVVVENRLGVEAAMELDFGDHL